MARKFDCEISCPYRIVDVLNNIEKEISAMAWISFRLDGRVTLD